MKYETGLSMIELLVTVVIIGSGIVLVISGLRAYTVNIRGTEIRWRTVQRFCPG